MKGKLPDVQVFNQTDYEVPLPSEKYIAVASALSKSEGCEFNFIEVVYVDEDEIVRINENHLERDYVTDIITFRYDESTNNKSIEGTMYCCAPRIKEQAVEFDEPLKREFLRIYIHGLLHLAGYEDKTNEQKQLMTAKENDYLSIA
ncbi:rRNA maturation RNase YbeY [Fodinibius saliphilus]|uniref:rRNA maturation RNase YbeY n=1 Tax=Fodinibius saliphilus TaxID=1920650 RepID=UPI0011095DAA|nr:rRNA maturation RNase YbeY [Fodinibius saliphilus]